MRFAIVGAGGVGGYFGARLAQAGHDVAFIARGAHLAAIRGSGLHVHSPAGDVRIEPACATDDPTQVGPVDCVLLAVKAWQVIEAARSAAPLVGAGTLVLPLQNGVEAPDQVATVLGREHALGGIAKIISFIGAPGHVHHTGVEPALVIGELDGPSGERLQPLRAALEAMPGASVRVAADIRAALWEKYLFITSWAGVGAVARAPLGVVRAVPETRRLLESALAELEGLARANAVALASDVHASTLAFVDSLPADGTASMQRDLAAGRPSELDNLTGAALRLGATAGLPLPVNGFIYGALAPLERRARGLLAF